MENQKPEKSEYVFPHIPYEILVEILLRLPATSLMRFKSVSKPWHALFSTQEFMTAHLEINRDNKKLIKYGYICAHNRRTLKLFSLESLLKDPIARFGPFGSKMNDSYLDIESDACMMCSCDGLICFFKKPNHIWIWNPATRKCRKLPDLIQKKPGCLEFVGFGYYEPSNDYKVVAIQCPDDDDYAEDFSVFQVYSLYAHRWETMKYYSWFMTPHMSTVSGVFLNNKPYWLEDHEADGICYFDFATFKFDGIEIPNEDDFYVLEYTRKLGVLDGCLCLGLVKKNSLELWLVKENGNEYTWTRFVSINHPCVLDVLHISKKGGILTMVEDKCRKRWLMLYDSKASSQRMLAIPTHIEVQMKTVVYVESLISI